MCNNTGRRTFHNNDYPKFDKFHYMNRVPFALYYDFECIIKTENTYPLLLVFILKVTMYPVILEDKYESYAGEDSQSGGSTDIVDWFISRMSYYNKLFKEIFSVNIPLKEDSITPLYSRCNYRNEN